MNNIFRGAANIPVVSAASVKPSDRERSGYDSDNSDSSDGSDSSDSSIVSKKDVGPFKTPEDEIEDLADTEDKR